MGIIRYSQKAKDDLLDIWLWVAKDSVAIADRIVDAIEHKADLLRDTPELGPARPEISADARSLLIERWLILYVIDEGGVRIVRVVDGARDLSRVL